jgi:hypothetical protein
MGGRALLGLLGPAFPGSAGVSPAATERERLAQPSTHHFARACTAPDGAWRRQPSSQPFNPASTFGSPAGSAGILPAQRRVRLDPTVSQPQPPGGRDPGPWGSNVRCPMPPASTRVAPWERRRLACSHPARILGPAVDRPVPACVHRSQRGVEEPAQLSTAQPGVHLRVPRWERRHPAGPAACPAGPERQPTTTVWRVPSNPALPGNAGLRFEGWAERFRGGVVCAHAGFGGAGAPPLG